MKKQLLLILLITISALTLLTVTSTHLTKPNNTQEPQLIDSQEYSGTTTIIPLDPGSGGGGRGETSAILT